MQTQSPKSGTPYLQGVEGVEVDRQSGVVTVFGIQVELLAGDLITKRDAMCVMQKKLEISDRQARAAVSTYCAQEWTGLDGQIPTLNERFVDVRSFVTMVQSHMWLAAHTQERNLAKSSKRQRRKDPTRESEGRPDLHGTILPSEQSGLDKLG